MTGLAVEFACKAGFFIATHTLSTTLGDWKTTKTVLLCYQRAPEAQLRRAARESPQSFRLTPLLAGRKSGHPATRRP